MRPITAAIASAALVLSAGLAFAQGSDKVVIEGSTTVGPIAKAFAEYYMAKHPQVNITVSETGSGTGAKALINGTCDIADMSRFMKEKEWKAAAKKGIMPVAHVVAMDGIAVVVNPRNSVRDLTVAQVKDIYLGKITNWRQLGGPNQRIVVISRDTNSGTYETFHKLVMAKAKMAAHVEYVNSNEMARQRVKSTVGAVAYVGLGFKTGVKALLINGVEATNQTVASGIYAISRPLYMFTNQYPKLGSHVHAFVTIHLSKKGQQIVQAIGYVPVTSY